MTHSIKHEPANNIFQDTISHMYGALTSLCHSLTERCFVDKGSAAWAFESTLYISNKGKQKCKYIIIKNSKIEKI